MAALHTAFWAPIRENNGGVAKNEISLLSKIMQIQKVNSQVLK